MVKSWILTQKPLTNRFGKVRFFLVFWNVTFFGLKSIFFNPEYQKTIFSGLICPTNTRGNKFDFLTKTMDLTLWKISIFRTFFETSLFLSKRHSFLSTILKKQSFVASFAQKIHMVKSSSFWQKPWSNPLKTFEFLDFWKLHFSGLKSILVSPGNYVYSGLICPKDVHVKKFDFFLANYRLNPLENFDFLDFFVTSLFWSKKTFFSIQNIKKRSILAWSAHKKKNTW